jgi:hypothetical protein
MSVNDATVVAPNEPTPPSPLPLPPLLLPLPPLLPAPDPELDDLADPASPPLCVGTADAGPPPPA